MTSPWSSAPIIFRNMPRYFWLLFVIFTITFGILLLDHFRTYSSQLTMIVIHKNEKTAAAADQVVDNVAELPRTLAFYDRLLEQFPEIHDPWSDKSDNERKELWLDRVFVERIDYSGLIRLRISADTAADASQLAEKSSVNLFQLIGQYYDIKSEFDIRTVDEPITRIEFREPLAFFVATLLLGAISAFLVSSAATMIFGNAHLVSLPEKFTVIRRMRNDADNTDNDAVEIELPVLRPKRVMTPLKPVTFDIPLSQAVSAEPLLESVQPAPAQNLPFLEEGTSLEEHLFGTMGVPSSPEKEDNTEAEDVTVAHSIAEPVTAEEAQAQTVMNEPTPEELKRRLNQLLRGDM